MEVILSLAAIAFLTGVGCIVSDSVLFKKKKPPMPCFFSKDITMIISTDMDGKEHLYVHDRTNPDVYDLRIANQYSTVFLYNVEDTVREWQNNIRVGQDWVLREQGIAQLKVLAPPYTYIVKTREQPRALINKNKRD